LCNVSTLNVKIFGELKEKLIFPQWYSTHNQRNLSNRYKEQRENRSVEETTGSF